MLSCNCAPTLGDYPTRSFQLSYFQVGAFLARHPAVGAQVAETKTAILAGLYDWGYNPATQWRIPGVIPPWGLQVEDSEFGRVTVFPAKDGTIYYTAGSSELYTDKPDYQSPTYPGGMLHDVLGDVTSAGASIFVPLVALTAVYLYVNRRRP